MELRKADFKNEEEMNTLKEMYNEAFPAEERAPFKMLIKRSKKGKAELYSLVDDQKCCGMVYMVCFGDMAYLFYFAVKQELRGQGLGTKALKAVLKKYQDKRLFLALEDWKLPSDNPEQRQKRHEFYQRCGLHDLPYHIKEASVVYAIMGNGEKIEPEEYKQLINHYLGFIMRKIVDMRIIK